MVTDEVRIDSRAAAEHLLGADPAHVAAVLVVAVTDAVPDWLAGLVDDAHAAGARVVVEAVAPAGLGSDALAGWEIGVALAALQAGATEVRGVAPRRLARVAEVVRALAAHDRPSVPGGPA